MLPRRLLSYRLSNLPFVSPFPPSLFLARHSTSIRIIRPPAWTTCDHRRSGSSEASPPAPGFSHSSRFASHLLALRLTDLIRRRMYPYDHPQLGIWSLTIVSNNSSKAVADGAIGFFCDHHVSARMARYMYGVEYLREIDVNDQEHLTRSGRQLQLPSGPKYLPDAFDCILAKVRKPKPAFTTRG